MAAACGIACLVIGCGGGGGGGSSTNTTVTSIVIPSGQAVQVDQLKYLSAQAYNASGGTVSLSTTAYTWSVQSGSTFLSFQSDGRALGLAEGTATVVASARGVTSSPATITITPASSGCTATTYSPNYYTDILTPGTPNVSGNFRKWTHTPLTMSFKVDSNWTQKLQDQFKEGVAQWQAATANGIAVTYVDASADADIAVEFVPSTSLPGNAIGITYATFDSTTFEMVSALVQVSNDLTPDSVSLATCSHELGHALGIGGHSPNDADLMYYAENGTSNTTARDLNTLRTVYCNTFPATASRSAKGRIVTERIVCPR